MCAQVNESEILHGSLPLEMQILKWGWAGAGGGGKGPTASAPVVFGAAEAWAEAWEAGGMGKPTQ